MSQNSYIGRWLNLKIMIWVLNSHDRRRSVFYVFWKKIKVILQKYLIKWSEDMKRITVAESHHHYHTPYLSLPVSPMPCRFSFHCGVWNWERRSQRLASDPFFLDRLMKNNQQTIHLARAQRVTSTHPGHLDLHPGLQSWGKAPKEALGWKLADGKWDARLGGMWSWHEGVESAFSFSRNNQ